MRGSDQPSQTASGRSFAAIADNIRPGCAASTEIRLALASVADRSDMVRHKLEEQWPQRSGRLYSICRYALLPNGKLFRPVLLLESTAAVGGELASSLPAAAGAEYGHVASLIHDDIIDGDNLRRGRPSVQHKYGIDDAIVAGDALIFHLFANLAECRSTGVPDSDVDNGRLTLPVILAYKFAGQQEREGISAALSSSVDPVQTLDFLRGVLGRTGAVDMAVEMAGKYAEVSRQALQGLPFSPSRDRVEYFAELVIVRDR